VKKLSLNSMQGKKEFLNEVKLVAKIQHRNLVNLLAVAQRDQKGYWFMSTYRTRALTKSYLVSHFHFIMLYVSTYMETDPNKRKHLDWAEALQHIKLGITRGLLYLHQDSQLRIIHRRILRQAIFCWTRN
jgi:serine/threonine protein kinase